MRLIIDNTFDFSQVWRLVDLECGFHLWRKKESHQRGFTESGVRDLNPGTVFQVSCNGRDPITLRYTRSLKPETLVLSDGTKLITHKPLDTPTRAQYLDHLDHVCAS